AVAHGEIRLRIEFLPSGHAPDAQELPIKVERLHAMIAGVGDVEDLLLRIDREANRLDELAGVASFTAEREKLLAAGVVCEDALVARVGDEDRTVRRHGDRAWAPKSGVLFVPVEHEASVGIELLDAMVPRVGDVDGSVGCRRHAAGLAEWDRPI